MITLSLQQRPNRPDSVFQTLTGQPTIVIAHRGASDVLPEETIAAYKLAIQLGAEYVEPDLVMTKDGVLICRHQPMLKSTTNVASLPEFVSKLTTKKINGVLHTDWFASDFTLQEIKKLDTKRHGTSKTNDSQIPIATAQELVDLVKLRSREQNRIIGFYPETKNPTFHEQNGLHITDALLSLLTKAE